MSRVITFSRFFPKGHPKEGQPTFFVEKILSGMPFLKIDDIPEGGKSIFNEYLSASHDQFNVKYHTIRAGNWWKVGDKFSPRVWSGLPYRSKQIQFAPDIEIKKIWDIGIDIVKGKLWIIYLNGKGVGDDKDDFVIEEFVEKLAKNDGLSVADFIAWFEIDNENIWRGQIICWDERIEY